jgi:hypothetical protein
MRATTCKRCKQPLYLPDGRMAQQVVATAMEQGLAYYNAGYDPVHAPGVKEASPILAHRDRSDLTWVGVVRVLIALAAALELAVTLVARYVVQSELRAFGFQLSGTGILIDVLILVFVLSVLSGLLIFLARYASFRVLYILLAGWLFFKYASIPIFPLIVADLIFYGILLFVLVMSLLSPSPHLPGGVKLNGPTSLLVTVLCLAVIGGFVALSFQAYHQVKELNQATIILTS